MPATSTYSTNRSVQFPSSSGTIVLEPPRHLRLPPSILGPGKHIVGSAEDCSVQISAEGIQQQHAMILIGDQVAMLKALDPRTWINDQVATETSLRAGDRLSIGPITYHIRYATEDERSRWVPPTKAERPLAPAAVEAPRFYPNYVPSTEPIETLPIATDDHDDSETYALQTQVESIPIVPMTPPPAPEAPVRLSPSPVEAQIIAIQQQLTELDEALPTIESLETAARQSKENQINSARGIELQQLADDLNRQTQRLRERNERVTKREEELERKLSRLAAENERLVTSTETTRRELASEYARQQALWQEWNEAYRRTTEELKNQSEAIEARRATIRKENDLLAEERAAVKKLMAECNLERQNIIADRMETTAELNDLHAQRIAFETERRQHILDIQEREADLAKEHHKLTASQDDLLLNRQQLETDRTTFATERSSESIRREQEIREHTLMQIRLTDEQAELQTMRQELDASLHTLDARVNQYLLDRDQLETEKDEIEDLRFRLDQAETDLALLQQTHREEVELRMAAERQASERLAELEDLRRSIETTQLSSVPPNSTQPDNPSSLYSTSYYSNAPHEPQAVEYESPTYGDSPIQSPSQPHSLPEADYAEQDPRTSATSVDAPRMPYSAEPSYLSMASIDHQPQIDSSLATEHRPIESSFTFRKFEATPTYEGTYEAESQHVTESASSVPYQRYEDPTVEDTLSSISRRFGYVAEQPMNQLAEETYAPIEPRTESPYIEHSSYMEHSSRAFERTEEAQPDRRDPSLDDLRTQLAQMFSLPEEHNHSSSSDQLADSSNSHSADEGFNPTEQTNEDNRGFSHRFLSSESRPIDRTESMTTPIEQIEPPVGQMKQEVESNGNEDPWANRLRELSKTSTVPTPPPVPEARVEVGSEIAVDSSANEDDEFSVEAQLARLLGRPRRVEVAPKMETVASDNAPSSLSEIQVADRSHLNAEPKHKQNKNAVREEVQSFREVAQMSARSALAKHSWNNLRNEYYFTFVLTVAAAVGALWYLSEYMREKETGLWQGVTCSIGAGICIHKLIRNSTRLKQFNKSKKTQPTAEIARPESVDADE